VTKVVQPNIGQSSGCQQFLELSGDISGIERRAHGARAPVLQDRRQSILGLRRDKRLPQIRLPELSLAIDLEISQNLLDGFDSRA
jgi:hypothetical protein